MCLCGYEVIEKRRTGWVLGRYLYSERCCCRTGRIKINYARGDLNGFEYPCGVILE